MISKLLAQVPYVDGFGTAYTEAYEREHFNLNKTDEYGNSMLIVAAQNGNEAVAKFLVSKGPVDDSMLISFLLPSGANPNHQNKMGQTAGHYANAYQ